VTAPTSTPAERRDVALTTYRYLRGGMAVAIVMLGASVVADAVATGCWQTSISAYFFAPPHSVFIATLSALGAMLIVYKGSTATEDNLLNLAGVLALIVAMVPTGRPDRLCSEHDLFEKYDSTFTIGNNVLAMAVALIIAALASWALFRWARSGRERSFLGFVTAIAQWLFVIVGLVGLAFFRTVFDRHAHGVAAISMFVAIIFTVWITAYLVKRQVTPNKRRYYVLYQLVAWGMLATLIAVVILHETLHGWDHTVIIIEAALIIEFAIYWLIQTVELWETPNRIDLIPGNQAAAQVVPQEASEPSPTGLMDQLQAAQAAPRGEKLMQLL